MASLFFNVWPSGTLNICPKPFKICQSRLKFAHIVNERFQNGPSLITLRQSGEISPNLVTLIIPKVIEA